MFMACGETFMSRANSALDRPGYLDSTRMQRYWGNAKFHGVQHRGRHLVAQREVDSMQQIAQRLILEELAHIKHIDTYQPG